MSWDLLYCVEPVVLLISFVVDVSRVRGMYWLRQFDMVLIWYWCYWCVSCIALYCVALKGLCYLYRLWLTFLEWEEWKNLGNKLFFLYGISVGDVFLVLWYISLCYTGLQRLKSCPLSSRPILLYYFQNSYVILLHDIGVADIFVVVLWSTVSLRRFAVQCLESRPRHVTFLYCCHSVTLHCTAWSTGLRDGIILHRVA